MPQFLSNIVWEQLQQFPGNESLVRDSMAHQLEGRIMRKSYAYVNSSESASNEAANPFFAGHYSRTSRRRRNVSTVSVGD